MPRGRSKSGKTSGGGKKKQERGNQSFFHEIGKNQGQQNREDKDRAFEY